MAHIELVIVPLSEFCTRPTMESTLLAPFANVTVTSFASLLLGFEPADALQYGRVLAESRKAGDDMVVAKLDGETGDLRLDHVSQCRLCALDLTRAGRLVTDIHRDEQVDVRDPRLVEALLEEARKGRLFDIAQNKIAAQINDEFAGATFSPDGRTLFVNIQASQGVSMAIWGPWGRIDV